MTWQIKTRRPGRTGWEEDRTSMDRVFAYLSAAIDHVRREYIEARKLRPIVVTVLETRLRAGEAIDLPAVPHSRTPIEIKIEEVT